MRKINKRLCISHSFPITLWPWHSGEEIAAIALNTAQFTDIPASAEVLTEISFNFPVTGEMPRLSQIYLRSKIVFYCYSSINKSTLFQ